MQEWPGQPVSTPQAAPQAVEWPGQPVQAQPTRPSSGQPRGVRNRNEGNLKDGPFARRQPGYLGAADGFAMFDTPENGRRAQEALLANNYLGAGFTTPRAIVNRYSPVGRENSPESVKNYTNYIANRLGVDPDGNVSPEQVSALAQAMREFENGNTVPLDYIEDSTPPDPNRPTVGTGLDLEAIIRGDAAPAGVEVVEIGRGLDVRNGEAGTLNQDGELVSFGMGPDAFNALPDEDRSRIFGQAAASRSAGFLAARERAEREGVGRADLAGQPTAPINDELGFGVGYGTQAIDNLVRRLTGRDIEVSALENARAYRDATLSNQEEFQREHPAQAIAGGVLGGFAFAPGRGAQVPGLLSRLGQAGGVSAAYGGAEADGGLLERGGGAALSGALGVATAGLLEVPAPVARSALGGIERLRTPAAMRPTRSEGRVLGAVERAIERDRMTPADVLANMDNLAPGRLPLEAGGENLTGLAETLAQVPGNARREITRAIGARQDDASNRITNRISEGFGADGDFFITLRQANEARSAAARQGMDAIGDRPITLGPDAVQAVRSERASSAIREAAANRLASADPLEREAGARLSRLVGDALDNPAAAQMTIRDVQEVSYALNEAASSAYAAGDGARGKALSGLARSIRDAGRADGDYARWLSQYGDASEAIDALRVGRNVFARANERNAMSAPELRQRWSDWSEAARENYRLGVGEALLDRSRGQGGVSAMRGLLKNQEVADRVRIAFGSEDAFLAFMRSADDEVAMQGVANQVLGNSATARRQAGRADLEAQGFGPMDALELAVDGFNPVAIGRKALKGVAQRLPRQDRSILGNDELNGLLGSALTDEKAMRRLLELLTTRDASRARVSAQTRGLGLLSVPGATGAGQERVRGLLTANP